MIFKELAFLISSYAIISDNEINDKELTVLNDIYAPSSVLCDEQAKIFSDDENKISIDELLTQVKNSDKEDIKLFFEHLFEIVYADGFFDQREKAFINNIAKKLDLHQSILELKENEIGYKIQHREQVDEIKEISWTETLNEAFKALMYELKGEKNDEVEFELLSGSNFVKKIERIARDSTKDLSVSRNLMIEYNSLLNRQFSELKKNVENIEKAKRNDKDVVEFINIVKELSVDVLQNLKDSLAKNIEVLNKKERTINYFTIAFMGRTKAGKSTIHKVVTHEKADDIGVGKLRTTRYNRSWYWENIRIVDTPGIGAPGGKNDTETTETIIDEADLICYVVTNDSIQTTEFDFLKQLKEKSKPLFIILNIKENLEHPARLKRFLQEPLKWKTDQGDKNIQGHIDRIKECIGDTYDFNFIEIIPLQLLAAKLFFSSNDFSADEKQALWIGSNMKEFVYKIKQSIYRTGSLKKTQNIVDGCCYQIYQIRKELSRKNNEINSYSNTLEKKLNELNSFIQKERIKVEHAIKSHIITAHENLKNNARVFADKNYAQKKVLQQLWENDPDNKRIYCTLSLRIETETTNFINSVKERVEECFSDLNFQLNQSEINSTLNGTKIIDWKLGGKITAGLLSCTFAVVGASKVGGALVALTNIGNPIGWGIIAGAAVAGLLTLIVSSFKSKEKKVKEAQDKLYKELSNNIESNKEKMINSALGELNTNINKIHGLMNFNFKILLNNAEYILSILNKVMVESEKNEKKFSAVFAYRILQQIGKQSHREIQINDELDFIIQQISATRFFEKSQMIIKSPCKIDFNENIKANELTQLEIIFLN